MKKTKSPNKPARTFTIKHLVRVSDLRQITGGETVTKSGTTTSDDKYYVIKST